MTRADYTHIAVLLDSSGSMTKIWNDTIGGFNAFLDGQKKVPGWATFTQVHFSSGRQDLAQKRRITNLAPVTPGIVMPLGGGSGWGGPGGVNPFGVQPQIGGCHGGPVLLPSVVNQWPSSVPYDVIDDFVNIHHVKDLTTETFVPGGGTPLLDCMYRMITETGEKLASMAEKDRPGKVLVIFMTDGEENASHAHTKKEVFDLITQQTEVYKWSFMYIGANQDAIQEAQSYGIAGSYASNFVADSASVGSTYNLLSQKVATFRAATTVAQADAALAYTDEERAAQMAGTFDANNSGVVATVVGGPAVIPGRS